MTSWFRRNRRAGKSLRSTSRVSSHARHAIRQCIAGLESLESRTMLAADPYISELLASNRTILRDSFGDYSDWFEIHNPDSRDALDLTNWSIRYKSTVWTFPAMTLGPGEFRVIFASSRDLRDPAGELHVNFNLDKDGANLRLINPGNTVVQEYTPYPAQQPDVSYGVGQQFEETKLVSAGATAKYYVPTGSGLGMNWIQPGFADSAWSSGPTGLGFANIVPGLAVTVYKASLPSLSNVSDAQSVIDNPSNQSWTRSVNASYINYYNTGGIGNYANDITFPGMTIGTEVDQFVTKAVATVHIPTAGQWTFGVNSDDGFRLTVGGQSIAYDGLRGPENTLGTFTFANAGDYELSLVSFENGGGSGVELFAAPGALGAWDATFALVGDTGNGGLAVTSTPVTGGTGGTSLLAGKVRTNVRAVMESANNATLYTRIPFDAPNAAALQALTLKMAYDDGFVAYLNGVEVARRNAPSTPVWNSAATASRDSEVQATTYEHIDITSYLYLLNATGNVLAIQAMNASAADTDLLLLPEVSQIVSAPLGEHFFSTPTPGAANTIDTWQPDISFGVDHGFFDAPFQLALTTTTPSASIYYTLDGSTPSPVNGTLYATPITISTTSTVRAVSAVAGGDTGVVSTQTYIFLDDVLNQPNNPAGFPSSWNGTTADYAMDPRITQDPLYSASIRDGLLSIPTLSLVTDQANFFDPAAGIYANPLGAQEVPVSVEYFDPNGSDDGFQLNAAIRMYGGVGREPQYLKHSMRLLFKQPYGPTKLAYDLFGGSATDEFDTLVLRSNFNDAWVWGDSRTQYIRDQFHDRSFLDMGQAAGHGTFVHLYVNGLYWGLYNPVERPDTAFTASYLGGDKSEWDGINAGEAVNESSMQSWNDLMNAVATLDLSTIAGYEQLQGNNPDGSRNPDYQNLLDVDNYIDYLLLNFFTGNNDWPGHNYYAGRLRGPDSTGFKSFPWDSEMSLDGGWSTLGTDTTASGSTTNDIGKPYYYLRNSEEFRVRFADHVYQHMFNSGALTPDQTVARYAELAAFIDAAIIGESARWGDVPTSPAPNPDTQAHWRNERDYMLNTYFPQRTGVVIQQLRGRGLYPSVDAPAFYVNGLPQYGGTFMPGDVLTLGAAAGTIYYTLDGSDPRLPGGTISPSALVYTGASIPLAQGTQLKARALSDTTWSALANATFYVNLAPSIRITELMYNPAAPTPAELAAGFTDNNEFEFIEIKNIGTKALPLEGLHFTNGISFTFPAFTLSPGQYVLIVENIDAFRFRYPSVDPAIIAGQYTGLLNSAGEEIDLDAPNGGLVHSFDYNNTWYRQTDGEGFSLTIVDPLQALGLWDKSEGWRSSAAPGGTPGYADALAPTGSIVFNEILPRAASPGGERIELHNTSDQPIDVGGWFLSDDATNLARYRIADGTTIPANGFLVLTDNNYNNYADPGTLVAFTLADRGGDLYLSSNASGVPGGYREHVNIDVCPVGLSMGRVVKSTGATDFALLETPTFGAALPGGAYAGAPNSIARISPIVISEIMYNPAPASLEEIAAGFANDDSFEFIELYNRSTGPLSLADFHLGDGIGFSFGWYSTGVGSEVRTLERNATATWAAPGLTGLYTAWARLNLTGADGLRRTNLDDRAQYTITHAGGSFIATIDQNQPLTAGGEFWVELGTFNFAGNAAIQLVRGNADPNDWTYADAVRFTAPGQSDVVVATSLQDSFWMQSGQATIPAGGHIVLVANYAAFDYRYHVAANQIPVAGLYTGNLQNGGEWVRLFQSGTPESGFIPAWETDRVNYGDHAPWPGEPDGGGPALIRVHPAAYGNDPVNWQASNVGGTPGKANIVIDTSAPSIPVGLSGHTTISPDRITLDWSAASDPQSHVDHYVIYRDNVAIATVAGATWADLAVTPTTRYAYQVSAVNRDGYEGTRSATLKIAVPGIASLTTPDTSHIEIIFSEPLTPATAGTLANYTLSGIGLAAVALGLNNTRVTLTTAAPIAPGASYDLTLRNLATASGNVLPSTISRTLKYTAPGQGFILREYWTGIGGSSLADLTNSPAYPGSPTGREMLSSFETPSEWGDNYGDRLRGYITPPTSGDYIFWIAGDDNSELYLSTDETAANAVRIAYVSGWTSSREWTKEANQQSAAITLAAGQRYYIEARHKEGGGGDNMAVRWQLPGGAWENGDANLPIPGSRLTAYVVVDPTVPTTPANLSATLTGSTQVNLQWAASDDPETGIYQYVIYRDGVAYATSTTPSYVDTSGVAAGVRHSYQVSAVNGAASESARSLILSVAPAGLASAVAPSLNSVRIAFSEPVTAATAQNKANYQIPGITISSATLAADGFSVTLATSTLAANTNYTLTVSGIATLAGNAFPASAQAALKYGGSILWEYWRGINGGAVADLTSNPNYPGNPSGSQYLNSFEAPTDWADYYGGRISGYVIPPSTGNYTFYIASDDNSQLWLSTDDNPANKVLIASVSAWTSPRAWTTYAQQKSAAIALTAGQRYYIEALQKEGSGGDNLAVAWKRPGVAFDSLPIPGAYLAPYIAPSSAGSTLAVSINPLATGDASPPLSGDVGSSTASITVSVNGRYYAASNLGDAGWLLPNDLIQPALASGTWQVGATAVEAAGRIGFDLTVNELTIDVTGPSGSIAAVSPDPRRTPLSEGLRITFTEPVMGFTLADVHLTRDGGSDLITGAETLTQNGNAWTLSGLDPITAAGGTYELRISAVASGITDLAGNPLLSDIAGTWTVDVTAPTVDIVDVTPDPRAAAIGTIEIRFSEPVAGFGKEDLALTRDGTPVSLSTATLTQDGANWTLGNLSSLTATGGTYRLALAAAGIQDRAGNALAAGALDEWVVQVTPVTADIVDVDPDPRRTSVTSVRIDFSAAVTGFGREDLTLTRNGTPITLGTGQNPTTSDNITWYVDLSTLTGTAGTYVLTLHAAGSGIADAIGNPLTADAADQWVVDLTRPTVTIPAVDPDPRATPVSSISIVFNEAVKNVDLADLTLKLDGGANLLVAPTHTLTSSDGGITWVLAGLSGVTAAAGSYTLGLKASGSGIIDLAGNILNQNASESWTVETAPVTADILDVTPDPRNAPVPSVQIQFGRAVTGLDAADLRLTRDGQPVDLAGATFDPGDGITWTVGNLASLTSLPGAYLLTLVAAGSGIQDALGNPIAADASDAWATDTTAPTATVSPVDADPRNTPVSSLTVTFSESISGLDAGDLQLTRDGQPVTLTGVTIGTPTGNAYPINGLDALTASAGVYELRLVAAGSGIADAATNTLAADAWTSWTTDTTAPLVTMSAVDADPRNAPVSSLTVTFTESISGFDITDLQLNRDGQLVTLTGVTIGTPTGNAYPINGLDALTASAGVYELRLIASGSGIADAATNALVADAWATWTTDTTAPGASLPVISPDPRNGPVGQVSVTLTEAVSGFDVADLRLTRDGQPIALTGVTIGTPTGNAYPINGLDALTASAGVYELRLIASDSGIADAATNALAADAWATWTTDTTAPAATVSAVTPTPRNSAIDLLTVTFTEAVSGFDVIDLRLTCDGQPIDLAGVSVGSPTGNVYPINGLSALTAAAGLYELRLVAAGSAIADAAANALAADAWTAWTTDTTAPAATLSAVTPTPRNSPVPSLTVTFTEAVSGFDVADLRLTRDGQPVTLAGVTVGMPAGNAYPINGLDALTAAEGVYELRLAATGSAIADAAANSLAADAWTTWTTDTTPPAATLSAVTPTPRNAAVESVAVTFTEAVSGLDVSDLRLTCDGQPIDLAGVSIGLPAGNTYPVGGLGELTAAGGVYELRLLAGGVADDAGNALAADASITWTMDITSPTATLTLVTPIPASAPVQSAFIAASETVDGLGIDDLQLTRDGLVISLAGAVLEPAGPASWTLSSLAGLTVIAGSYELRLVAAGSQIVDPAGNALAADAVAAWVQSDSQTIEGEDDPSNASDTIRLRRSDVDPDLLDVFINNPGPEPTYSLHFPSLARLVVNGLTGDDLLIVDASNGPVIPPEGIAYDGGEGLADALHVIGDSPQAAFALVNSSKSAGEEIAYSQTSTITVGQGAFSFDAGAPGVTLNAQANATINLQGDTRLSTLHVGADALVNLPAGLDALLLVDKLAFDGAPGAWQGRLDLHDNALAILNGVLADVTDQVGTARNTPAAGAWQGQGITTGSATEQAGLATFLNDDGAGNPIVAGAGLSAIVVRLAPNGDASLDGILDGEDYFRIDSGFLAGATAWRDGNFDYRGGIDGDDFYLLDHAYLSQASALAPAIPPASAATAAPADVDDVDDDLILIARPAPLAPAPQNTLFNTTRTIEEDVFDQRP